MRTEKEIREQARALEEQAERFAETARGLERDGEDGAAAFRELSCAARGKAHVLKWALGSVTEGVALEALSKPGGA